MTEARAVSSRAEPVEGRLLEVAARLFRAHGFAGTSTRALANELGVKSPSLYHHVKAKDDLLFAVSVGSLVRIRAASEAATLLESDPRSKIGALIRAHLQTALEDQDKHAAMLLELKSLPTDRRREVVDLRKSYEDFVTSVIASAQAAGVVRDDIAARHLALALLNLLNWTIFWFRSGGGLTVGRWASVLEAIFLGGLRSHPVSD